MNQRLKQLTRTVIQEQAAAAMAPTEENIASLKRCQDRLQKYLENSGRTCPLELFFTPPVMPGHKLVRQIHDEFIYVRAQ